MARKAAAVLAAIIVVTLTAACTEVADSGKPGGQTVSPPSVATQPGPGDRPAAAPTTSPTSLGSAGGSGISPAPGSFPRSFLIPGTDTSISIGGSVGATAAGRFGQ